MQGHRTAACGEQCPTGQALSDGRCVPRAVIAAAARKARGEAAVAVAEPAAPAIAAVKSKPDAAASEPGAQVAARIEAPAPVAAAAPVAKAPVRTVAETIRDDSARAAATPAEVKPAATAEAKPAVAARVIARAEEIPAKPEAKHVAKQLVAKPAIRTAAVEANVEPAREPLPGRMTIGGPVPERTKAEEPVTSSTTVDDDDAPKAAAVRKPHQAVHAPKPVHAPRAANHPAPRVVHTPAPPSRQHVAPPRPRYVAPAQSSGGGGAAARQRALVYNLFQRPDRF